MTAGERRKLHKNMDYERSARTIAVLGVHLAMIASPIALIVLAAAFVYGLYTGHNPLQHVGVLTAVTAPIVGSNTFLDAMTEAEGATTGDRPAADGVAIRGSRRSGGSNASRNRSIRFLGLITNKPGLLSSGASLPDCLKPRQLPTSRSCSAA
jgi:hypothetical protein